MKYILIGSGGTYVSFGGELRERFEWSHNSGFGIGQAAGAPRDNNYLLQRLLLHADLHVSDNVRVFVQVGPFAAFGENDGSLGATQNNRGELAQAFIDLSMPVGTGDQVTLRAGRQETAFGSGRFVSERDGPNLRRDFDGARAILSLAGGYRADAFITHPVRPDRGAFNDSSNLGEAFWGVYTMGKLPVLPDLSADLYYLGYNRANATFAQGAGFEQRHTVGARLFGKAAGWDWDCETAGQFGRLGGEAIRAWTFASDTGYTFSAIRWQPRLGLKADIASGDGNQWDHTLGTFNALYSKVPYFTEAGLVAPANLIDFYQAVQIKPTKAVALEIGWDVLWCHRTSEALYRPGAFGPIKGTAGIGDAYIGNQIQMTAHWAATENVDLRAWYIHFTPGSTVIQAGGQAVDFAAVSAAFKF